MFLWSRVVSESIVMRIMKLFSGRGWVMIFYSFFVCRIVVR